MDSIINDLVRRFGATVAKREECEKYLTEQQHLLFGLNFNDPQRNYLLLTENDLQNMSQEMRMTTIQKRQSPFTQLQLIVYADDNNEINFKLLHGMASCLVIEMVALCEHPEIFSDIDLPK